MQLLKRVKWVYVLLSLFLIALGVCLLVIPGIAADSLCLLCGGGAVVFGIVRMILYFLRPIEQVGEQYDFAIGATCIIAGAVLLVRPQAVLDMVPQVLGVYLLVDCMFKLQIALDAQRLGGKGWWLSLLVTVICMVWGMLLIWMPFGLDAHRLLLVAGGLIADGVQNFIGVIYMAAVVRKPEAEGGEITEPAEFVPVAEPVAPAEAPQPAEPKKKFSLFEKKDAPAEEPKPESIPEKPAQPEEDDGAVAEIKFEMTEEETHELHS